MGSETALPIAHHVVVYWRDGHSEEVFEIDSSLPFGICTYLSHIGNTFEFTRKDTGMRTIIPLDAVRYISHT